MLRDYKTWIKEGVGVFSGKEIEHTLAYGLQTLFLARNDLTYDQIQELCESVEAEAVYYGANRSFISNVANQVGQMTQLLERGYFVTLDYPYSMHNEVQKQFNLVWNHEKFIPFCWVVEVVAAVLEKSLLWFTKTTVKLLLFWMSLSAVEFRAIVLRPVLHVVNSAE